MAGGICIYGQILVLIAPVFKPALDNFRAAFRNDAPDFRNFMRFEPAIEGEREVVQPDFTLVAGLEDVNVHPLGQIIAVKADPIAILDEHRWHDGASLLLALTQIKQILTPHFLHAASEEFNKPSAALTAGFPVRRIFGNGAARDGDAPGNQQKGVRPDYLHDESGSHPGPLRGSGRESAHSYPAKIWSRFTPAAIFPGATAPHLEIAGDGRNPQPPIHNST
jgi:hypothetical protein